MEKNSRRATALIHSFVFVPFLLALSGVLVFAALRGLTFEKRTPLDCLNDIRHGGPTRRWQAAFDLSRFFSDPGVDARDPCFSRELASLFVKTAQDDPLVREYLALAMGRTGNPAFVPALVTALRDERSVTRLAAVIALGMIGDRSALSALEGALSDLEPNVRWDAAISLAKLGSPAGKSVLASLLDRRYLSQFSDISPQEQQRILAAAIQASLLLKDAELMSLIRALGEKDGDAELRRLAKKAVG